MNDIIFCKSFRFNEYCFPENAHRDNTAGVGLHFVGFMKEGHGRLVTREETLLLSPGDMFYIPKGCRYRSYWTADAMVRFDSIGFLYFPTVAPNGYKLQKISYDRTLWEAFQPLSADKAVNAASIGALYRLLGMLESTLTVSPGRADAAICEKLLLLMRDDPHMTIPEYATLCQVSESLLYSYVKRCTGKTPNRLRQEVLCQKAAQLLTTTGYTVEEICSRLNFSSAAYFRKVFQSIYHKSPTQIRKEDTKPAL